MLSIANSTELKAGRVAAISTLPSHISYCILAPKLVEQSRQVRLPLVPKEERTTANLLTSLWNKLGRFVDRFKKPTEVSLDNIIRSIHDNLDSSISQEELKGKIDITEEPFPGTQASYSTKEDKIKVSKNRFFVFRRFFDPFQLGYVDKLPGIIKNFLANSPHSDPQLDTYHEYMHRLQDQFIKGLTYDDLNEVKKEIEESFSKQFDNFRNGKLVSFIVKLGVSRDFINDMINQLISGFADESVSVFKPYCTEKRELKLSLEEISLKKKVLADLVKALIYGTPWIASSSVDAFRAYVTNPCEIEARITGACIRLKDMEKELNALGKITPQNKEVAEVLIAKSKTCKREIFLNVRLAEIESLKSAGAPDKEVKRHERELYRLANDLSKQSLTSSFLQRLFRTQLKIFS